MNWQSSLSWLSALTTRPTEPGRDDPDPADMGTAFGLDASFGPIEFEPSASFGAPTTRPWEHRLTRRSSL